MRTFWMWVAVAVFGGALVIFGGAVLASAVVLIGTLVSP